MWIGVISLFPDMFRAITDYGITKRAIKNGFLYLKFWNPRKYTCNQYRAIDERPYGGGPGMLMMIKPLQDAINNAKNEAGKGVKVIYLSPQGRTLDQNGIMELVSNLKLILVCGRYKGIDERLIEINIDEEWSIGDYVITGGELAAMVLIDSVSRLIPGVLGHKISVMEDSFFKGILDCPHYTRPAIWHGKKVPEILLSGNHAAINRWRLKQALGRTWLRRPELLKKLVLTNYQEQLLSEFKYEN